MKIAIIGNQARAMSNFWTVLIRQLTEAGHEALCVLPAEAPGGDAAEWEKRLASLGARVEHYPLDRKGLNPLKDLSSLLALSRICRREKPDRLFAYSIKPVVYGALASALAGQPPKKDRFVMITGLGYMFEGGSALKNMLTQAARLLYRLAFSCSGGVFFQNEDDLALFKKLSILPPGARTFMSRGCGVDTDFFAPQAPPQGPPVFLYVGRLLEAKGLRDLAAAARIVKARKPEAVFRILGPAEYGPGAVPLEEVLGWQSEGIVEYLGATKDVRPFLGQASVVLLPSWREGTPTSLMEAMSAGRALVAADAPGSREVVRQGINGFLVPVKDPPALANAVESFILDPGLASRMGAAGRELACSEFRADLVAAKLLREMGVPPQA